MSETCINRGMLGTVADAFWGEDTWTLVCLAYRGEPLI